MTEPVHTPYKRPKGYPRGRMPKVVEVNVSMGPPKPGAWVWFLKRVHARLVAEAEQRHAKESTAEAIISPELTDEIHTLSRDSERLLADVRQLHDSPLLPGKP